MKDYRDDREYLLLKSEYLSVIGVIHQMEMAQAADKRILKSLSDPQAKSLVRARIMKRRRGANGLAAYAKTIRQFYEKYPAERPWKPLKF